MKRISFAALALGLFAMTTQVHAAHQSESGLAVSTLTQSVLRDGRTSPTTDIQLAGGCRYGGGGYYGPRSYGYGPRYHSHYHAPRRAHYRGGRHSYYPGGYGGHGYGGHGYGGYGYGGYPHRGGVGFYISL